MSLPELSADATADSALSLRMTAVWRSTFLPASMVLRPFTPATCHPSRSGAISWCLSDTSQSLLAPLRTILSTRVRHSIPWNVSADSVVTAVTPGANGMRPRPDYSRSIRNVGASILSSA